MSDRAIVRTSEEVVEDIRRRLEGLWNVLYQHPELITQIDEVWSDAEALGAVAAALENLAATQQGALQDMAIQRDMAVRELQNARSSWIRRAWDSAIKDLAADIARETDQEAAAVEKALLYLAGDRQDGYASIGAEFDAGAALAKIAEELSEE